MPLAREIFETPHGSRRPKWGVMLTAYVDESCHDQKDLAIVAGFLGNAEQWDKCEKDWIAALGSRRHLHLNRLRWSNEKRVSALLNRLGPIPHNAGLTAVLSAVRVADYEDLIDGTHMQKLMKGYFLCVWGIVNMIMQNIPPDETFKLVLENQTEYANGVIQAHRGSREQTTHGHKKWASVEFVEKDDTVLTEPGDFLAYALLQQARDPESVRARLCCSILQNTGPVFARDHRLRKENAVLAAELSRLQWQPITPENLPKVGDEVTDGRIVLNCNASMGQRTYAEWRPYERTYFRPFDPPKPKEAS